MSGTPTTGKARLRVVIVAEAAAGGVATHLADLVRGLAAMDQHVHLILPESERLDTAKIGSDVQACCASVSLVPMQQRIGWRDALAWLCIYRLLWRIRPDIVHSHSSKAGALARGCIGPWRQVYTPHALYTLDPSLSAARRRVFGGVEALLGRLRSHRLIAVSHAEARHANEALGIPRARITTIHNGVSDDARHVRLTRVAARRALGLHPTQWVVGFVGRFAYQKGVDRLVRVAELLYRRFGPSLEIAVVGIGDFAAAAGMPAHCLPANLRLIGKVDHASACFPAFDALLLPSRYEGFPYVYLEAMAAQVPIVTTRVAGANELVDGEQIGLVVINNDDPRPLADALERLLRNEALRQRMRRNCADAAGRYAVDTMVQRTAQVYHEVVNGEPR
nr:glycosyltransferase [uncultured Cupriavidus sp.]